MPAIENGSDVVIPLETAATPGGEVLRGCTFFIGMVGTLTAVSGAILLISRKPDGRAVLIFSATLWLVWIASRAYQKGRKRAFNAQPSGQIRLTATMIAAPSVMGEIKQVRWIDLETIRLTRDTGASVYYEFLTGAQAPAMLLERSRVKDPDRLDRELASRSGRVEQTFEWERPNPMPPHEAIPAEVPEGGERFELSLPSSGFHTLRGCGGLLLTLAVITGLALRFSDVAMRWFSSGFGTTGMIALLLLGIFLATRSPKARMVCGDDGLHIRAAGKSFPSLIRWSDLRDYTFVSTSGRHPATTVTIWTPQGSFKLERVRIRRESELLSILRERSARKAHGFYERSGMPSSHEFDLR